MYIEEKFFKYWEKKKYHLEKTKEDYELALMFFTFGYNEAIKLKKKGSED